MRNGWKSGSAALILAALTVFCGCSSRAAGQPITDINNHEIRGGTADIYLQKTVR